MNATDALVFALGVYVLTLVVAVFVAIVIGGIRRITADKPAATSPSLEKNSKRGEATA